MIFSLSSQNKPVLKFPSSLGFALTLIVSSSSQTYPYISFEIFLYGSKWYTNNCIEIYLIYKNIQYLEKVVQPIQKCIQVVRLTFRSRGGQENGIPWKCDAFESQLLPTWLPPALKQRTSLIMYAAYSRYGLTKEKWYLPFTVCAERIICLSIYSTM
jgi:hypothetical protein